MCKNGRRSVLDLTPAELLQYIHRLFYPVTFGRYPRPSTTFDDANFLLSADQLNALKASLQSDQIDWPTDLPIFAGNLSSKERHTCCIGGFGVDSYRLTMLTFHGEYDDSWTGSHIVWLGPKLTIQ